MLRRVSGVHSSPYDQRFVDGLAQLEDVVADGQVVLQPEGLEDHAVSDGEGQPQVVARVTRLQTSCDITTDKGSHEAADPPRVVFCSFL